MQADPATWIDILQGDERLYGQLVRPLSEIPATDPRYAQQVRGLKAVFEGLDGARSRERIAKVFLSESTTVSEALAPPEIATDWSVNPSRQSLTPRKLRVANACGRTAYARSTQNQKTLCASTASCGRRSSARPSSPTRAPNHRRASAIRVGHHIAPRVYRRLLGRCARSASGTQSGGAIPRGR